jgi:hypothetical protein
MRFLLLSLCMPFTFAHPAIVMPINRVFKTRLSLSGLVIGSMVPDFEGYILVTDVKTYSHTWHGMFWLDLPLGFAIAFLFHTVVRDTLIDNLPAFFRRRLIGYKKLNWNKYCKEHFWNVVLAMFIGIFSHLLWDDFTHANGFFVRHMPLLQGYGPYAGYKVLQYVTSILGVLAVILLIGTMPQKEVMRRKPKTSYWLIVICTAAGFTSFRFLIDLDITNISLMVITILSGGLLGTVVAPLLMKMTGYVYPK